MIRNLVDHYDEFEINHVPKEANDKADILSKLVRTKNPDQHQTLIHKPFLAQAGMGKTS